jgi:hypothetical protein
VGAGHARDFFSFVEAGHARDLFSFVGAGHARDRGPLAAALACALACAGPAFAAPAPATVLLQNGHIRSGTAWTESMAIRDGTIVATGSTAELASLRGSDTRVIDLHGATVLPGLHDSHVHPLYAGLQHRLCQIAQGSTRDQLQAAVKECASRAAPGAWITGGQWDASSLGGVPARDLLDAVSGDHPVLLVDTSGHSSLANGKALALAGITRDTPDPATGIIERDAAGEPTGVFREDAMLLASKPLPPPTDAESREALAWSLDTMLAQGITSFTEAQMGFAAGGGTEIRAYTALADSGRLKQRVRLCLEWYVRPEDEDFIRERNRYARERITVDCLKVVLDGVPTDSHTAAMVEDYGAPMPGRSDEAARKGMLLVPPAVLNDAVTRFDAMGLAVKFHAAGDGAVRAGLDAIEAARRANGPGGPTHDISHCTFVHPGDVARAKALNATYEVSPYLWSPTPINRDIAAAVADARMQRVWPVRELIDSGALVVAGSDWSVVPSVSPWIGIETLVTRQEPGGSTESFGKAGAITLDEAFALFTANAARHAGTSDRVGTLAPGMLADFIVLDRDPWAVPVTTVHQTRVQQTWIAGERVYHAAPDRR